MEKSRTAAWEGGCTAFYLDVNINYPRSVL